MPVTPIRRWLLTGASATVLILAAVLAPTAPAVAASGTIHPGTMMYTSGAQCTANFVFTDASGTTYVGYAAHCAGTGGPSDTNGCQTGSLPLGTPVDFSPDGTPFSEGTVIGHGTLAYSSWLTEQKLGVTDPNVCQFNDLALVRVDAGSVVDPTVPFWGGPTGVSTAGLPTGAPVYGLGNSSLRLGLEALQPRSGTSLGDNAADAGWAHSVFTLTPAVPGDSGSGYLDSTGAAVGVLSTLGLAPVPGENGLGDLSHELVFAQQHSGISGLRLVPGRLPFSGSGGVSGLGGGLGGLASLLQNLGL